MGNNDSRVSIIIATYNAEKHLHSCLQSIRNQKYKNIEVIIIDGGSTDQTINIIKESNDIITKWISEPDKGIYDALNKGINISEGNWLYFLGADDILLDGFSQVATELNNPNCIYYGFCINDDIDLGTSFTKYQIAKMNICHHAIFYPKIVFTKYTYNINYKVFADYLLNIQCWGDNSIKKKYLSVPIAKFQSGGFSFNTNDELFKQQKPIYIKKHLGWLVYLRYLNKIRKEKKKYNSKFF